MATLPELKQQSMKLETEISDRLEQWQKDNAEILDRKMKIDMQISEMEVA